MVTVWLNVHHFHATAIPNGSRSTLQISLFVPEQRRNCVPKLQHSHATATFCLQLFRICRLRIERRRFDGWDHPLLFFISMPHFQFLGVFLSALTREGSSIKIYVCYHISGVIRNSILQWFSSEPVSKNRSIPARQLPSDELWGPLPSMRRVPSQGTRSIGGMSTSLSCPFRPRCFIYI